jgi:hypothetical protein
MRPRAPHAYCHCELASPHSSVGEQYAENPKGAGRGLDRLELQTNLTERPPNYDAMPCGTIEGEVEFRGQGDIIGQHETGTRGREVSHFAFDPGLSPAPDYALRNDPVPRANSPFNA